ncbi:MAG: hypothetical protein JWQ95_1354 [Sphaerisporangium sp.]|nr:hypothetical protein [Sphaerisporangium sp.]
MPDGLSKRAACQVVELLRHLAGSALYGCIPFAILERVAAEEWDVYIVDEVRDWIEQLDDATHMRVVQAIDALADGGPGLGRPLVDTITASRLQNLKELRPGTVRILFAFDPWRSSILLVAGDKAGQWNAWYRQAIPLAEQRYETYLKERQAEEGKS